MVPLREPTDLGDRGERGGETESSDMAYLARRARHSPGSGRLFHEVLAGVARSPDLLGGRELGALASRWRLCGNYNGVEGARILS